MFIVKLEEDVWISAELGDPGRTCKRQNAQEFFTKSDAVNALDMARKHRPFPKAIFDEV
jgi:hypothetical protein